MNENDIIHCDDHKCTFDYDDMIRDERRKLYPNLTDKQLDDIDNILDDDTVSCWEARYQDGKIIYYSCTKCGYNNTFGSNLAGKSYCEVCGRKMINADKFYPTFLPRTCYIIESI